MTAILLKNCRHLYGSLNGFDQPSLLQGHDVLVENGAVTAIGVDVPSTIDTRTIDASRWLVLPGLVNTHHHLSQQLTRTEACDAGLVDWLTRLYPVWRHVDAEIAYTGARVGIAELMLSGCTTISDFTYYFPPGRSDIFDAQVEAARSMGCRFAPVRGGLIEIEAGVRDQIGGVLDRALERPDRLLSAMAAALSTYHDIDLRSMCRVSLGITEKTYSAPQIMRDISSLAGENDVGLHTHLHPRPDERIRAQKASGLDPLSFLESVGWLSRRLWVAHGTGLTWPEIARLGSNGTGLSLSPSSNARFGLPIAPGLASHQNGVNVSIGVDGAASNDSGNLLAEARLVLQTQRILAGVENSHEVTIPLVINWLTEGGARTLGWSQLGRLAPDWTADLAAYDLTDLDDVGVSDPLAALLLCASGGRRVALTIINGVIAVQDGQLVKDSHDEIAREGHRATRNLWNRAHAH